MATFINSEHMKLSEALQLQNFTNEASFVRDLEKNSKLMQILPWYPTADGSIIHKGVKAASLPSGSFGAINKAIPTGVAATKAYEVACKFFELKSDVDARLFEGMSVENMRKARAGRDSLYLKGYLQSLADEIINNKGADPDAMPGLLSRRAAVDGKHVVSLGGTASNKLGSILFIRPGEDGVCLRYPTATTPMVSIHDMGLMTGIERDADGNVRGTFPIYETIWRTYYGIDVNDDDALYRIVNVPTDKALTDSQMESIIEVVNQLDNDGEGYVALAPLALRAQLWKWLNSKSNMAFTKEAVEGMGKPTYIFNVPFFHEEYMSNNEGVIA